MNKLLQYLNGKKTYIGAALLGLGAEISGTLPAIPLIGALPAIPVLAPAVPFLMVAGTLLGGAGLFHKIVKGVQAVLPGQ